MKRIGKILLCALLIVVCVISLTACISDEQIKSDLLNSAVDATQEGCFSVTYDDGQQTAEALFKTDSEGNLSADVVAQGEVTAILLVRGETVYSATVERPITTTSNLIESAKTYVTEHTDNVKFLKISAADLGLTANAKETSASIEAFKNISAKVGFNLLNELFNTLTKTSEGYVLSVDFEKTAKDAGERIYQIAQAVDQDPTLTVSQLYLNDDVQALLKIVWNNVTAEEIYAVLSPAEQSLQTYGLELLVPAENETATDYFGRYLETIKIDGTVTVGSVRIADLLAKINDGEVPKLTEELKSSEEDLAAALEFLKQSKAEMTFDGAQKLKSVTLNLTLPKAAEGGEIISSQTVNVKAKLEVSDGEAELWDVSLLDKRIVENMNFAVEVLQARGYTVTIDPTEPTKTLQETLKIKDIKHVVVATKDAENLVIIYFNTVEAVLECQTDALHTYIEQHSERYNFTKGVSGATYFWGTSLTCNIIWPCLAENVTP